MRTIKSSILKALLSRFYLIEELYTQENWAIVDSIFIPSEDKMVQAVPEAKELAIQYSIRIINRKLIDYEISIIDENGRLKLTKTQKLLVDAEIEQEIRFMLK